MDILRLIKIALRGPLKAFAVIAGGLVAVTAITKVCMYLIPEEVMRESGGFIAILIGLGIIFLLGFVANIVRAYNYARNNDVDLETAWKYVSRDTEDDLW